MFKSQTLFIIGAGASKDIGFPLGATLFANISETLDFYFDFGNLKSGDGDFLDILNRHFQDRSVVNTYLQGARKIAHSGGLASSVDQFIDTHFNDETIQLCGKTAIIYHILKAEKDSSFSELDSNYDLSSNIAALKDTWQFKFSSLLFEGIRLEDLENLFRNISIICFNYDRSIEYFLPYAIMSQYAIDYPEAQKIVDNLHIIHPYGTVGTLPTPSGRGISYGHDPYRLPIVGMKEQIKTFTEQVYDGEQLNEIKNLVANAETIVFLGFGFLEDNMKLLTPSGQAKTKRVYATAYRESDEDRKVFAERIFSMLYPSSSLEDFKSVVEQGNLDIKIDDCDCLELFKQYGRRIQTAIN
ncbi:MAG: hypothetical protein AAF228_13455 [Pseudomonadota bacterium]